jgi:hypothetical protein
MDTTKGITFFSIRNLADMEVAEMESPWDYDASNCPWDSTKEAYKEWMKMGSTDHCLYSAIEPQYHVMRTGPSNEACYIHAFVADYDGIAPQDPLALVEKQSTSACLPNYVTKTFSNQIRLVWLFERPLRVMDNAHAAGMLKHIGKKLHADKWFAKLDKKTYDPKQFWCIGKEWLPTSQVGRSIKGFTLDTWAQEYFMENQKSLVNTDTLIPIADLEQEAQTRGFQRVTHFEPGRHCRRFWDPASDNDNGCLITEHGVCVYVPHDKPFMAWRDIFGREFTAKYENKKFDKFYDSVYYDNAMGNFWYLNEKGDFIMRGKTEVARHLKCLGSSASIPKGGTSSDLDERLLYLELNRTVDQVSQLVYFPVGVVRNSSRQNILNISRVRTIDPGVPQCDAKLPWMSKGVANAFPFIHGLITHLFAGVNIPGWRTGDPSQIDVFLWWLARFYRAGYYRKPASGHVMFLAGGTGQGKSLLASFIIPELMGGTNSNAESFLLGKTRFNSSFAKQPVVTLNDCASANVQAAKLIRDTLKQVAADGSLMVAEKFGNEEQTPWFGRFIVTLNTDHDSMMILPELNASVRDKFIYLMAAAEGTKKYAAFGERDENEARIRAELPIFARYLLDMPLPKRDNEWFDIRFGFKAWQHPIMVERCMTDESCEAVLDAMDMAFSALAPVGRDGKKIFWEGSATELYMCLAETGGDRGNECFRNAIRSNMRTFGKMLAKIRDMGYDIKDCGKNGRGNTKWRVYYGIVTEAPPNVKRRAEALADGIGNFEQTEKEEQDGSGSDQGNEAGGEAVNPGGEDVDSNITEEVLPV